MNFHVDGTLPNPDDFFVFGSNMGGRHGKGAALIAKQKYGAKQGVFEGVQGRSYAIPTKTSNLQTLRLNRIHVYVEEFILFAQQNPQMKFFVTRVGCGLAGYQDSQVAPMFKGAPDNCNMPEDWKQYLES